MPNAKKSININDTSLFAELVKGSKHKRDKVLKEILATEVTGNGSDQVKKSSTETNGDLKDIPVPPPSNGIPQQTSTDVVQPEVAPLPPLPTEQPPVIRKVTELPMPPGVVVPMDLKTPSPPKDVTSSAGPSKKVKLTELPMPPMTVPGTEDLSDDENDASIARKMNKIRGNGTTLTTTSVKIQRPKIINRRLSRGPDGDWGERCVEVFEIIAQIGEGG